MTCLESMRLLHSDAISNTEYNELCYSNDIKLRNQGGLAQVSPTFFKWAKILLSVIRTSFTATTIKKHGSKSMVIAYADVTSTMEKNRCEFNIAMNACLQLQELRVSDEAVNTVRCKVMSKVFHARSNVVFKRYKSDNVGRIAQKESEMTLRQDLKALTYRSKKEGDQGTGSTAAPNGETSTAKKRKAEDSVQLQISKKIFI